MRTSSSHRLGLSKLFVVFAALAVSLTACGGSATQGTPPTGAPLAIKVQIYPASLASWLAYIADAKGMFAKHGLSAQLVTASTGAQALAGLASDSIDMAAIDVSLAGPFISQGQNLTLVSGIELTSWTLVATQHKSLPNLANGFPQSVRDLKGAKIGVFGLGTSSYYFLVALLKAAGMSSSDVTIIPTGGGPQEVAAIRSGQVDAAIEEASSAFVLIHDSGAQMVFDFGKGGSSLDGYPSLQAISGVPFAGFWANSVWVKENAETTKRFQLAMMDADVWAHDRGHLAELTGALGQRLPKVAAGEQQALVTFSLPYIAAFYTKNAAQAETEFFEASGVIKSPISIGSFYGSGIAASRDDEAARLHAAGF